MDLERLLKQIHEESSVFKQQKGRPHEHFKKFKTNLTQKVNSAELKKWMSVHLEKLITQL